MYMGEFGTTISPDCATLRKEDTVPLKANTVSSATAGPLYTTCTREKVPARIRFEVRGQYFHEDLAN